MALGMGLLQTGLLENFLIKTLYVLLILEQILVGIPVYFLDLEEKIVIFFLLSHHQITLFFLKENITKNKLKNISLIECAVGEKENLLPLYFANPKNPGAHSLIKDTPQQNLKTEYLKVKVNTLDSLFGDLEIIHLMKIDIEGFELNALKGGLKTLKKVQNLLIEFSPHLWKDSYNDAKNFFKILNDIGFKPHILEFGSLKDLNKIDIDLILDFLKNRNLINIPIRKIQKDLVFTKA
jgi:FkbM family methyltransferase